MQRHQFVVSSCALFSGIPIAIRRSAKLKSCIKMFVEVPKPLSSNLTGIDSPIIFEVAHKRTPAPVPKIKRPKHMSLKLSERDNRDPINPSVVNIMIVLLGPYALMKSPPNRDPALIPKIDAVDSTVM